MSEERLARIESKLDGLTGTVETLAGTVATLAEGQAHLQRGQEKLEARVGTLETGQDDLRRHMSVLHEDVIDKMRALDPAPLIAATERRLRALIDDRHEEVLRRLDPIEVSVQELYRRQAAP